MSEDKFDLRMKDYHRDMSQEVRWYLEQGRVYEQLTATELRQEFVLMANAFAQNDSDENRTKFNWLCSEIDIRGDFDAYHLASDDVAIIAARHRKEDESG